MPRPLPVELLPTHAANTSPHLLPRQVRITAVGLGNPEDLRMPAEISDRVHYHTLVPYKEFYTYLCQSFTLLPLFSPIGR